MQQSKERNMVSVFYIRSNEQESLNLQILKAEKYAEEHSLSINIIEDTKTSGLKPFSERQGIQRILQLIEEGSISTIIVDTLHRVSRDGIQLLWFIEFLRKNHIKLVILDGGARNAY